MWRGAWEDLAGAVLEGRYRLLTLVSAASRQAEFLACPESAPRRDPTCSVTLLRPDPAEIEEQLAAAARARRLLHPNLLRVLDSGTCPAGSVTLLYVVTELFDSTLAGAVSREPLPEVDARRLAADLAAALEFIHGEGLVCRTLDPETIVRIGAVWKLADLSQLERPGRFHPEAGSDTGDFVPPEASTGLLLPAWDVWALGVTLRRACAHPAGGDPAPPLDAIVRGCLEPDPHNRMTLSEIAKLLNDAAAPVTTPPDGRTKNRLATVLHGRAAAGGLALFFVCCVALAVWYTRRETPPAVVMPPPIAVRERAMADYSRPSPFTGSINPEPGAETQPAAVRKQATLPATPPKRSTPASYPAAPPQVESGGLAGLADYFADNLNGLPTASGERFSNDALTAAHREFPFGTLLRVTNLGNGQSVVVRVNDRGPFRRAYIISVTRAAATRLGFVQAGSARVRIEQVRQP